MPPLSRRSTTTALLTSLLTLVLALGGISLGASTAAAATTYTLAASGAGWVAPGGARTLTVTFLANGAKVASSSVSLQYKSGSSWVSAGTVKIAAGTGTVAVKPPTTGRTYRFYSTAAKVGSNAVAVNVATITPSGAGTVTEGSSRTLSVTYLANGAAVASSSLTLQYKNGTTWVKAATVKITAGKGTVAVKPPLPGLTYRFVNAANVASASVLVRVVPATFSIAGSGAGHGAGMSQYGAYALAKQGKTTAQILGTYYTGAKVDTANNPWTTIAVQVLGYPADARTSTTIHVDGPFTLAPAIGTSTAFASAGTVTTSVSASNVTATVTLDDGSVTNKAVSATTRLRVTWTTTGSAAATATVAGAQGTYRYGTLDVTSLQGRINVANNVILNSEYLYGIDEMPASWGTTGGQEALKAQVVATRTYAIRKLNDDKNVKKYPGGLDPACNCNVFDDTRSQNYTGWKKAGLTANAPWVQAVDQTRDDSQNTVTVVHDAAGAFAETPYFASTGKGTGWGTANNADVWGTAQLPYLVSVADTWTFASGAPTDPYASWTDSLTQAQVKTLFAVADVKAVTVTARYPGGLVKTLTATTSTGATKAVTKTAEAWRSALGVQSGWVVKLTGQ
ncbi:SpoIID/LytB domain-containing protein [Xylanimonas sp. McL0601]|uniref:SpoIID/LytB domain-containing protein n=1 Tax=Xylanimonas sp. McL0601 TaxID=3414739 RepID=UPI003CE67EDF